MRKTKIVCTLGPASDSERVLEGMIRAGMDVARLNFSHGSHDEHRKRVLRLRKLAARHQRSIAILQDIQGPKIRLGDFVGGKATVRTGDTVTLTTEPIMGDARIIPVTLTSLPREVHKKDIVLIDDGRIRLQVERVRGKRVEARVMVGGIISNRKGLNLPGSGLSLPSITRKDERDLVWGQELGVDYIALSFVRTAEDIRRARAHVIHRKTPIIAKIEKPQAVSNLQEIATLADGIMVARGDLGVELPLETLPAIQKNAVSLVNRLGGVAIVATEMLESMISSSRPTRAEVTDVANAVLDGADALMLSGETAVGQYPVEAVATMARIIQETERTAPLSYPPSATMLDRLDLSSGVAAAAVTASDRLNASLIIAYTESGYTARLISEFRPRAPILALTPNLETSRRMALYWGVKPMQVGRLKSTDAMLRQVKRLCANEKLCEKGSCVIIVAGVPLNQPGNTNMMTVHRI